MARRSLKGKRALVTGASRGLGLAISRALVEAGCIVTGLSRTAPAEAPLFAQYVLANLCEPDAAKRVWEGSRLFEGDFDIVINNAGSGILARFEKVPVEDWERSFRLSALAAFELSRLALPKLVERSGALVNVSSLAVDFPIPFMSGYNMAKAALSAFTLSLQMEYLAHDLQLVDLRPGDLNTNFNEAMAVVESDEIVSAVWTAIRRRCSRLPVPDRAARSIVRILQQRKSGTLRVGTVFQAKLAPLFSRLVPERGQFLANLSYYGLKRDRP